MKKFSLLVLSACFSLSLARAGSVETHFVSDDQKTPLDLFSLEGGYVFESKLTDDNARYGKQDAFEVEAEYSHRFHISGKWYFRAGLNYNRFDFGGTSAPVPDRLESVGGLFSIEYCVDGERGAFLEVRPGFYGTDLNHFGSDSFDALITLGRAWVLQKDKIFLFTGVNTSFLRGEFPVIPLAGLVWHFDEHWLLYGVLPEPRVVYMPNKKLDIWVGGQLTGGSFRTEENNNIFPRKLSHAVVDYSDYRAGAGIVWHASNAIDLDLGGGYSVERRFNYERAGEEFTSDPAPYLRLFVKAEF